MVGTIQDVTERKVFEAQLTHPALHDSRTGLPNRTLFLDRLEQALAKSSRRQVGTVAVLFMDLDDFKNVNDSLGHEVGDELLKAVGTRLKEYLRPGDTAARLGGDEFVVYFQPKVLLETGRIVGVEALIRWESPERGLTLPAEFVPMAEELRLIVPVGREVLKEACQQASEWRERYPEDLLQMVSVNLSASQLQHPDLLREVSETLQRTGLDPRNLILEITESVVMSDAPSNIATLVKLRHLGLEMAIDDFGTGYSSLSYLKRLPVSYLKIDRSFVERLRGGSDDKVVVSGIIALAHTLGMRTIAEGVEPAEQLRILRQIGCELAQGHYFSPPLAPDAASELLAADPRW
jgi:diguanylate cyclase (GGDEF)-like protein